MPEVPQRFDGLRNFARIGGALGAAAALALIVIGVSQLVSPVSADAPARFASGGLIIAAGVIVLALLAGIWSLFSLLLKLEATAFRSYDALRELQAQASESTQHARTISENVQLSEVARSISHRNKERTVLRLAINDEIIRGDWEAAYALVEQLEARHGYKNEATRLRAELDNTRELNQQRAVHEAVELVKSHMREHDWDRARREMDDLIARNPDHPEIQELPDVFDKLRNEHKRKLLKSWDEAVQRRAIDEGIAILKELDQYLTHSEAAALSESARGVFQAKLHNYGVQFSLAATEGDWGAALRVGRAIIDEYPNSRMAQEVRDRIHILTKRAEESEVAAASQA